MTSYEELEIEAERDRGEWGDPRRCPRHGCVTSSPDGLHDAPCPACEAECDAEDAEVEAAQAAAEALPLDGPLPMPAPGVTGDRVPMPIVESSPYTDAAIRMAAEKPEDDGEA